MAGVGDRIRQLRGKASRESFSNKYHIHRNTLERWEKGLRTPSEAFLMALAEGEKVNIEWVKFGQGQMELHPDLREKNISPLLQRSSCDLDRGLATVASCEQNERIQQANFIKNNKISTGDVASCEVDLIQVLRENADLLRQNGDLRVEVERLRMDVERRDARIAELERQLAEALKAPQSRQNLLDTGRAAAG
ncbi:helix-turn-helix domain-containing protein [Desulfovibrio fairfieldensis]|nr:helix-turn-helix transcriptional regulator [Desulfovibrio fairfieldensis]